MLLSQLANVFRQIRTRTMIEFEKNKDAIRQGAATAVAVAAVAALLPAVSMRAAEQRADAEWDARAKAFHAALAASNGEAVEPAALLTLASYSSDQGSLKAQGAADLNQDALANGHAMFIQARVQERLSVASLAGFHSEQLSGATERARETRCLAEAIYYEARGESVVGQLAVAEVVVNRVRSKHYPDTFCDVVYEGSYRSTGCQFTFTCDGSLRHRPFGAAWRQANVVAGGVIAGFARPMTHSATHYHTNEVDPYWSGSLIETTRIGAHIFYRFPNRVERARLRDAAAEQQEAKAPAAVDQVAALAPAQQPI
jgi:spore germination cell wall hydrolase CwlJ-like protein